jgi:Na+-translocating ferredoxin:NAD+ oxidoreductase RnfD subunit
MFQPRIAVWCYYVGLLSAVVAIFYRVVWFGGLGARLFGPAPRIVAHNFLDLSILLFVISIATNAHAMVHGESGKAATGREA